MSIPGGALLFSGVVLLGACAEQVNVAGAPAPVRPQVIGKVKSLSFADIRTILDLERDAIVKEFHSPPSSITIRVIDHNHVMIFFEVRGQQYGDPVDRIQGKWKRPGGPRATIVGPNQALERTADRHVNLLSMTSTVNRDVQFAVVRRRSSCVSLGNHHRRQ